MKAIKTGKIYFLHNYFESTSSPTLVTYFQFFRQPNYVLKTIIVPASRENELQEGR